MLELIPANYKDLGLPPDAIIIKDCRIKDINPVVFLNIEDWKH